MAAPPTECINCPRINTAIYVEDDPSPSTHSVILPKERITSDFTTTTNLVFGGLLNVLLHITLPDTPQRSESIAPII